MSAVLSNFRGEDNLHPDTKLTDPETRETHVRAAVNVDLDSGTFRRRAGTTLQLSGTDCHSLWSDDNAAFYVDNETLYQISGDAGALAKSAVLTGLAPGSAVSFCSANGEVYATNGTDVWRIADGVASASGIKEPSRNPDVVIGTDGSLPAGYYRIAISFMASDGEESGTTFPVEVYVSAGGTLSLSSIPVSTGYSTVVYMTMVNDDVLCRQAVTSESSLTITAAPDGSGARCQTGLMRRVPPGQIIRHLNGRLFVASGCTLFYSEPYMLGLYKPSRNYIQFPVPITMLEPCENGIYLAADKTYWIGGDVAQAELAVVSPSGAVLGTGGKSPDDNLVHWMSPNGTVVGNSDGQITNLQDKTVAVSQAPSGAAMFRDRDGMRRIVTSLFNPSTNSAVAQTFIDAEVVRKGTTL